MPLEREEKKKSNFSPDSPSLSNSELFVVSGGLILVFLLLYTLRDILSPFLVFGATLFFLFPMRKNPTVRNLLFLAILLFVFWMITSLGRILTPFIVSLLLAYILHPFVTVLEKKRIPRWISSIVLILFAVAGGVTMFVLVAPIALQQFESIFQTINIMVNQFTQWLVSLRITRTLLRFGISTDQLQNTAKEGLNKNLGDIVKSLLEGTLGVFSGLSSVISSVVNIVIIPFLTFYFLKDFPVIRLRVKMLLPRQKRDRFDTYAGHVDEVLGRYLRGTALIGLIDAAAVSLMFLGIGIQYPLVMGLTSGLLTFIPYFGFLTMLFISTIVASLSPAPVMLHIVLALATVATLHIIENYVLAPRIIGRKIGLHPALLILSLLTFSYFLGFVGLMIAIPSAAIIIVFVKEWERTKKQNRKIEEMKAVSPDNGATV